MAPQPKNDAIQLRRLTDASSHDAHDGLDRTRSEDRIIGRTEPDQTDSKTVTPQSPDEDPYKHLTEDEATILKRQIAAPEINTGFLTLYRYASINDVLIIALSCVMSIGSGATMPLMIIVFGSLQGTFQDFFQGGGDFDAFSRELGRTVLYFVYLAIGGFVATYTSTVGFIYTGEHISAKIREHYLEHCLRQNIGFFDKLGAGEVTTRISADTNLIQEGISEKVGLTLAAISTFFTAFIIAYIKYWKLALILSSILVALVAWMGSASNLLMKYSKQSISAHALGGSLAEEVISSIRNAVAFGAQDRLAKQYEKHLDKAEFSGFRSKSAMGIMMAGIIVIVQLGYGLAFWQGGQFVVYEGLPFEKVLITVMAVVLGSFSIGNVAPNAQAFATGLAAASKIYSTIDRESPLDPFDDSGDKLEQVQGSIRLENVKHVYPSRPEVVVMDDVSLVVPAGKTTALVGASGSGKSTIVGLIERFYEPVGGVVYIDGHDISSLNLRWLRQQISLVGQEPTLFGTTIFENIKHGLIGTKHCTESDEHQRALIVEAARKANAHDFISGLPNGYETNVGTTGFLLSGGQKQRIAIARAIVSDPKILLLDEATSALDTKSEGVVQVALEAASESRTTIVIAHRLSTIRNAHNIVVMAHGKIVEQGTHDELLQKQGVYFDLVTAQNIARRSDVPEDGEPSSQNEEEEFVKPDLKESWSKEGDGVQGPGLTKAHRISTSPSAIVLGPRIDASPEANHSLWASAKFIASFNKNEKIAMVTGLFFSIISGGGTPVQAVLLSKAISTLSTALRPSNLAQVKKDSDFWAAMYIMLAGVLGTAYVVHGILFAKCSERLIHRARYAAFRALLRQDISFFDLDTNTAGALTSFLSTKTTDLAGLSGVTLGTLLTIATTLIAGLIIGIAIGWKLALVCTSTVPVLLACGYFRFWVLSHFETRSKNAYSNSASYASEAVSAIRTIASLTREADVLSQYRQSLAAQQRRSLVSVLKSSLLYALSESLTFLILGLCFWYGGTLIARGEYSMFQFFVCFMSVIFSAQSAGAFFSYAANMSKAYAAAQELKALLDRKPTIDAWSQEGEVISNADGHIEFRDVHFRYPTRPDQPVLRGIDLNIRPGQYVALVGASGCGKSTTISLLERFYDPVKGGIFIDGKEISTLNISSYRALIAIVSQEPTLYQGTIKENIVLGTSDISASDSSIERACREANIYDFIVSLPDGLDTTVGSKGALLSGGQKQRIAIARALIRNPKILLLDEATSALDSESEHVVQAALDKAAKGRTTIAVAHRLSTVQKADVIFVFDQGRIVERGTHNELLQKNGYYAELAMSRSGAEWFSAGLASSFPDIGLDDYDLSQPRMCNAELKPGCKVFQVPRTDVSKTSEVSISAEDLGPPQTAEDLQTQVLVFQHRGKFHAVDHQCPHSSFPLSKGATFDIEDFGVVLSAGLMCPKHGWSFDLFTGTSDRGNYLLNVWDVQLRWVQGQAPSPTNGQGVDASESIDKEVWVRRKQRIG
ncbi:Leptomycin B resistance protein pmd1 [Neonectria ditissima]|uniref:Leptomycin B resistance protein pmd1 n=1 Tax=Neonectria ditissima TaxID=78410 RepID=A0A0P7BQH8_9HYPO|nr:Leptomycin B resistance protein pmd1 [Neonectria ditissima]